MERNEEEQQQQEIRIHVGGLGENVTNDDVIRIFASLGKVKAVEMVKTKGRSFGYVDFFPSSDKSLSKLFSTYNGCVWKGGKLRFEKAKEHYLARLKREWAEDEEDALLESSPVDADKDMAPIEKKPKKVLDSEKEQLKIFFPRLRKIKSLPFSGSGKHKYSFQRVEARPVPKYFCDCEEHSVDYHTVGGKQIHDEEAQDSVINEDELNIMNSVMNKLFERENVLKAPQNGAGVANEFDENETESVADEDNLIINVLSKGNNRTALSGRHEKTTVSPKDQKLTFRETRTSNDRPAESELKVQKKNILPPSKKRKSLLGEESSGNENLSANPGGDVNLSIANQSTINRSWSQKLPWRALVGDKSSSVFSVSNILPVGASTKEEDSTIKSIEDDLQFHENEEDDEDNLIINVVSNKNYRIGSSGIQHRETISTVNQKATSNKTPVSKDKPVESVPKVQKKSMLPLKKKRKSLLNEESDTNQLALTAPEGDGSLQSHTNESVMSLGPQPTEPESGVNQSFTNHSCSRESSQGVGDKGNDAFGVSNILPDVAANEEQPISDGPNVPDSTDSKIQNLARYSDLKGNSSEKGTVEAEVLAEAQPTETDTSSKKSQKGSSWFQKYSWTQLTTEIDSSFSITQISPGITFEKREPAESHWVMGTTNPGDSKCDDSVKQDKIEPNRDGSTVVEDGKEGTVVHSFPEKNQQTVMDCSGSSASTVENKCNSAQGQTSNRDVSIGETCSFMRSAASLKEWQHAKAVLSGSNKRKSNEKQVPSTSKRNI